MNADILIDILEYMYLFVMAALAASFFIICIIDFVKDGPNTVFRKTERFMRKIFSRSKK